MTVDSAWLEQKFGSVVKQADVQAELESLMRVFKLTVEDFYDKWEVFDMNTGNNNLPLTIERLKELRDQIQRDLERDNLRVKKATKTPIRTMKRANLFTSSPAREDL